MEKIQRFLTVIKRENCQDLVTGEMGLVREGKESRVTARFEWVTNGPSLLHL